MSANTLLHRAARVTVRPLCNTRCRPNHITTLRLLTGLAAVVAFASGANQGVMVGGTLFVLSAFLDRADGELARLSGLVSRAGHRYDLFADVTVNVLAFVGIGIGLWRMLDASVWLALGIVAGVGVALAFWLVVRAEVDGVGESMVQRPFDADDALLIVGPAAWFGWLEPLLLAAAIGAPLFALCLAWSVAKRGARQHDDMRRQHRPVVR